jgi:hypothetical protein
MYLLGSEWWPQKDPITGQHLCHTCWNHDHEHCGQMFDLLGNFKCQHWQGWDGFGTYVKTCDCVGECGCVHLSENIEGETKRLRGVRKETRKVLREQRDDPGNPLRAMNYDYKAKRKPGTKPPA